jgi:hypothetical protein
MHHIRACFTEEIPSTFQLVKGMLADPLNRIELMKVYEAGELSTLFRGLVDKVL